MLARNSTNRFRELAGEGEEKEVEGSVTLFSCSEVMMAGITDLHVLAVATALNARYVSGHRKQQNTEEHEKIIRKLQVFNRRLV